MKPLVIAHRGASAYAPENTLTAFNLAFELGADGIELDVELTKDGVPVVFHSDREKRTHSIRSLEKLTLAEVKQLDAGTWFDPKFRGAQIPTLTEVLSAISSRSQVVIELKWSAVSLRNADLERATANTLEACGWQNRVVSSFHPIALYRMRRFVPDVPRAMIYQTKLVPAVLNGPWFRSLVDPQALHVDTRMVETKFAQWARRMRYPIIAWHTEHPTEMRRLIGLGVNGIMSNTPDVLLRVVNETRTLEQRDPLHENT